MVARSRDDTGRALTTLNAATLGPSPARLFPLTLDQAGRSLTRLYPELRPGRKLEDFFTVGCGEGGDTGGQSARNAKTSV